MNCNEWSGRFSGIAGNAEKFHKNRQILNQTKRNINKSCLGKISRQKTVRINFPLIPSSRICSIVKNENPENQKKAFYIKKHPEFKVY